MGRMLTSTLGDILSYVYLKFMRHHSREEENVAVELTFKRKLA